MLVYFNTSTAVVVVVAAEFRIAFIWGGPEALVQLALLLWLGALLVAVVEICAGTVVIEWELIEAVIKSSFF